MKCCVQSLFLACLLISGCSTIIFDNGPQTSTQPQISKWHHDVAFDLYELSDPVNLKSECDNNEWSSVKTELSLFNWVSGTVTNFAAGVVFIGEVEILFASFYIPLPIWFPKSVEITCEG